MFPKNSIFNAFPVIAIALFFSACGGKGDESGGSGSPKKVNIDLGTINVPSTVVSGTDDAATLAHAEQLERDARCENGIHSLTASARLIPSADISSAMETGQWQLDEVLHFTATASSSVLAGIHPAIGDHSFSTTASVQCMNGVSSDYFGIIDIQVPFQIRQSDGMITTFLHKHYELNASQTMADTDPGRAIFAAESSLPSDRPLQNIQAYQNNQRITPTNYLLSDGRLLIVDTIYSSSQITRVAKIYQLVQPAAQPQPEPQPQTQAQVQPQPQTAAPDSNGCDDPTTTILTGATELTGNEIQSVMGHGGHGLWRLKNVTSHRLNDFQSSGHRSQIAMTHHDSTRENSQISIDANATVECLRQGYVMGPYRISMQDPIPYEIRQSDLVASSQFLYSFDASESREVLNTSTSVGLNPLQIGDRALNLYLENSASRNVKLYRLADQRIAMLVTYPYASNGQTNTLQVIGTYELTAAPRTPAQSRTRTAQPSANPRRRPQGRHR